MTFTKLLLNLSRFPPLATRHHTPRSGQTRGNRERSWGFGLPQKLALVWSGPFTTAVSSTGRFASWFWPSTLRHVSHPTSWVTNISTFQLCGLRQCFLPSLSLVFLLCLQEAFYGEEWRRRRGTGGTMAIGQTRDSPMVTPSQPDRIEGKLVLPLAGLREVI